MLNIILAVLWLLVAVCLLVGLYAVAKWVFKSLGVNIPDQVYTVVGVLIVLLIIIWFVTALAGGGPMPWHAEAWHR